MPNPCDLALRERAVTAYERGDGSYAQLAALFDVDHRTLERWVARWRDTQSMAPQPRGGGWPCPVDVTVLRAVVRDGPDATVTELCWEYTRPIEQWSPREPPDNQAASGLGVLKIGADTLCREPCPGLERIR
jgi:transposase